MTERVWVEEFGGGAWVEFTTKEPIGADALVRNIRKSVLYPGNHQEQAPVKRRKAFRGNRVGY